MPTVNTRGWSVSKFPGWISRLVYICIIHSSDGEKPTSLNCRKEMVCCTTELVHHSDKRLNVLFYRNGVFAGNTIFWKPIKGS